jgi:hypothetical protein
MAQPILQHLDAAKVAQLQNFIMQPLSSAPGSPVQGQMYFDTTLTAFGCYTGTVWQYIPLSAAVLASLFDAQTVLAAITDNTPAAVTIPTEGTVGRTASVNSGNVGALTWTQVKTALGALNTFTAPTGSLSLNSQLITSLATPVSGTDAATKAYVDSVAVGIDWKPSVRVASTANVTVSNPGTAVFDGVTLSNGDRILLKNQTTASENGIYTFTASGTAMVRGTDADSSAEVNSGMAVFVEEGTANADKGYLLTTNNPITLGTTSLTFTQFSGAGGTGTVNKSAGLIGDGSTTAIVYTHGLGTDDVGIHVYRVSDNLEVWCDKARTSTTQCTLTFATAPATNAMRVVVLG